MDLNRFDVQLHATQYGPRIREMLMLVSDLPDHQAASVLLSAACIVVDRMPKENLGSAGLLREDMGRNHADSMMDLGPAAIGAFLARLAVLMPKVNETVIDVEGGVEKPDFIQKCEQIDRVMDVGLIAEEGRIVTTMNMVNDYSRSVSVSREAMLGDNFDVPCLNPTKGDV